MDSFGDFLEWPAVGIDANKELVPMSSRRIVHKEPVAGSDVNNDSSVGSNQFLKCSPINLSKGFTAD